MSMEAGTRDGFVLKGWHVLLMFVGFFGVIVTVNFYMAVMASKSWTGLYSKNGYVASQEFNQSLRQAAEQRERGWRSGITYGDGALKLVFRDRDGNPLHLDGVTVDVGHPVASGADRSLAPLSAGGGQWQAPLLLTEGRWYIRVKASQGELDYLREARIFVNARGEGRLE